MVGSLPEEHTLVRDIHRIELGGWGEGSLSDETPTPMDPNREAPWENRYNTVAQTAITDPSSTLGA